MDVGDGSEARVIESRFADGDESWGLEGFDTDMAGWTTESPRVDAPTYLETGGNPGGCLTRSEAIFLSTEFFVAPARFLGDQSIFYGGELAWDLRQERDEEDRRFEAPELILEGSGITLYVEITDVLSTEWSNRRIVLDADAGWRNLSADGRPATESELREVLSGLTSLWIRAEYHDGSDDSWLDNVVMQSVL